ncbi:FG-GAP repeat domain-containing protein [Shewanella ulleungensis]|uniref:VCBS repeat-containing protein n=1 Tax=Shewanella ulleungensis TaxID=2282699 RepID=A0ABQ2QP84_9GAMM|nr:VCBS repeat-containing protein [Shewanella ulleungensis]MCL1151657.1 VCBS repeat-containing protein [Shewanella ulleungensis]GGP90209.1 hypothetical protein GCM10009410_25320 [Shewanella ulleungensis]
MSKKLLILLSFFFVISGCGGDSSNSDQDSEDSTEQPTEPISLSSTTLPAVDGRELITDIASTDLNQDGINDLILVRVGSGYSEDAYFQALINDGNDSFEDKTDLYFASLNFQGYSWVEKIYLVDLNNDGKLDIVSHHDQLPSNLVKPMIQNTDGQFEFINLDSFEGIGSFVPVDADNDGDIDLMAHSIDNFGDSVERTLSWTLLINNLVETDSMTFSLGTGSISSFKGVDTSTFIYSPVIFDLNFDGLDDVFYGGPKYVNGFINELIPFTTLVNAGEQSFIDQSDSVIVGSEGLTHVREISAADFNGDSFIDVLVSSHGYDGGNFPGEKNQLLIADGTGKLIVDDTMQQAFNYQGFTHSHDVGDIDGDGDIDIVFSDITGADIDGQNVIQILVNDGNANFSRRSTSVEVGSDSAFIVSTKLVDLNADGFIDLVVGGDDLRHPGVIVWNDGAGSF